MGTSWDELRDVVEAAPPGEVGLDDARLAELAQVAGVLERARGLVSGFWELLAQRPRAALAEVLLGHAVTAALGHSLRTALAIRHATALFVLGRARRSLAVIDGELERHPRGTPGQARGRLLALRGKTLSSLGELSAALVSLEEANALAERDGTPGARAGILAAIGCARLIQGDATNASSYFERGLLLARDTGYPEAVAVALGNRGLARQFRGELDEARDDFAEALRLAQESGDQRCALHLGANLGQLDLESGDLEAARVRLEASLTLAKQLQDPTAQATCLARLAACSRTAGAFAAAEDQIALAARTLAELPDDEGGFARLSCGLERGRTQRALGQRAAAIASLEGVKAESERLQHRPGNAWCTVELGHALGQGPEAVRELIHGLSLARELEQPLLEGWAFVGLAIALASGADSNGADLDASAALERALAVLPSSPARARAEGLRAAAEADPALRASRLAQVRSETEAQGWGEVLRALPT